MIEQIKNIGKYVNETFPEKSIVDSMVNKINSQDMKYILKVNVKDKQVYYETIDFYKNVTSDALFYQSGNGALGGGVRLDFYEQLDSKGEYKGRNKLKLACSFCEIDDYYEEIKDNVETYLNDHDKNTFLIITLNNKNPKELFEKKFLDKMYSTMYKALKGKHKCHLCGSKGKAYNTTTYKFYTNDKETYGNIDDTQKTGFAIGEECLNQILVGKEYIEEYLSTYWIGKKVMFLPYHYDEDVAAVYEATDINDDGKIINQINKLRLNEEEVIYEIGKTKAITDIFFYEDDSKFFYINHVIQSILPSRFTLLGNLFKKYKLRPYYILNYIAAVKVSLDNVETTDKEQMKMLDSIFTGKKIDRNLFFKRVIDVYKTHYIKDEVKKFYPMKTINYIYNFLCECNCLEKGWNVLKNYQSYNELFQQNTEYFDSNEKKAWFILGKAYNTMIYYMKIGKKGQDQNNSDNERTSLEKTFFFARKFDFNDFIYFSNLLTDKAVKYKSNTIYFKNMLCEAKDLMAKREGKLSFDESKYLFFWGMDSYFVKEDEKQEDILEEEE